MDKAKTATSNEKNKRVVLNVDGEEWDLEIEKEYDEEIGITFENEFMDQYRSCSNNCIFCFID